MDEDHHQADRRDGGGGKRPLRVEEGNRADAGLHATGRIHAKLDLSSGAITAV
jgi:hypothetical protein